MSTSMLDFYTNSQLPKQTVIQLVRTMGVYSCSLESMVSYIYPPCTEDNKREVLIGAS